MIRPLFGRIAYLNLLPFSVLVKRLPFEALKNSMKWHRGVPSQLNRRFLRRRINAAFISSIASRRAFGTGLGIVADKEVRSVLVVPGERERDSHSQTSNLLATLLGVEGRVLIGDKALYRWREGGPMNDLAAVWHERTGMPFVFARLCAHEKRELYRRIARQARTPIRLPQTVLRREAVRLGFEPRFVQEYLRLIHYRLDPKALRGLALFLRLARLHPQGRRRL